GCLQSLEQRREARRRLRRRREADDNERRDAGGERGEEDVRIPPVETLAGGVIQEEVRRERGDEARERAPAVGAAPHEAAEQADADKRRQRLGEQEAVEHAFN